MRRTWRPATCTLLTLAVFAVVVAVAQADDDDNQGGGYVDNTAAYMAQQAYWQAWDHWLTIYQEQQQAIKDEQARMAKERKDRQLYNPPMTVIWSAQPLNALLKDLANLSQQGATLPTVYIPQELLPHINLTSGISEGHVAALGGTGKLTWPLPLTGNRFKDYRSQIDTLMARLVDGAKKNQLQMKDFKAMDRELVLLDMELLGRVNDWNPSDYMEAKRFVSNIRASLKVLRQPDAPSYFNKDYTPKGKTVAELVAYLNTNGLQFAPAGRADERAYIVFHRAMAACDMAANAQADADAAKADADKVDAAKAAAEAQMNANPLVNPGNQLPVRPKVPGSIVPPGR